MKGGVMIFVLGMLAMVQVMVQPGEAITCPEVNQLLGPCLPYLTTVGVEPSQLCCAGATKLQDETKATADKRAACECVKTTAAHLPNIKPESASSLPAKCKITMNIPIAPTTNCQDIN